MPERAASGHRSTNPSSESHRIYDVSLVIEPDMITWANREPVAIESLDSMADGAAYNVSLLRLGSHCGTHVDAPRHFSETAPGVETFDPQLLVGPARLLQLPEARSIDSALLKKLDLAGVTRLLFGTPNCTLLRERRFQTDYTALTGDAAQYLVDLGIKLVGIDYLSIEEYSRHEYSTHRILLEAGVVIVEGLDLSGVPAADYELMCLPLKIRDGDGAPARVFLREMP